MYTIAQIADITGAHWHSSGNPNAVVQHLVTDSRRLLFPAISLFCAIDGPRRSGSSFVKEMHQKGVRQFLVNRSIDPAILSACPNTDFLMVEDVLKSLQTIAAFHRKRFSIPVIGITGSNGKTVVKEWLYQLLQSDFQIVRSPRSYNSQIGVPLSIWQMNDQHTLAIFEAGISQPGEMERLEDMIQPTLGIFTNLGDAHNEGFSSDIEKAREKAILFKRSQQLVVCADQSSVMEEVSIIPHQDRNSDFLETWGQTSSSQLRIHEIDKGNGYAIVRAAFAGDEIQTITIPFTDDASIENALHCWRVMLHFGYGEDVIADRMRQLKPVAMRLELKQGINQCSVVNDSYSNDLSSLAIALDFIVQQQQHQKRTIILSDILQSGKSAAQLYAQVANLLEQKQITRLVGIGKDIGLHKAYFNNIPQTHFFDSVSAFREAFYTLHFFNETILLKGARVFEFEQISHLLEAKTHQTVLEIDLDAILYNLRQYQQQLHPGTKLMAMVKAFSYGSGSFEIANLLQFHGIDYLAVAYADEGVELRRAGISLPIMVMNPESVTFDQLVQYQLEPELFSFHILNDFRQYLITNGLQYFPVHLKMDTGMHRLGFVKEDLPALCNLLATQQELNIKTVFSHLVASDAAEHDGFTQQQADQFAVACEQLQKVVATPFLRHIANTSAIHRHPHLQLDMVRLGIGLYGVDSFPDMQEKLKNVSTLKTTVAQIKAVKAGESVGYSRKGITTRDSLIATVRIGYADGYPRRLGNGIGHMLIRGQLVPVIGNVCMDMTMVDVTGLQVEEGDEVIVFGNELPVSQLAKDAGTIAYEILAGISQRVKRVYFGE